MGEEPRVTGREGVRRSRIVLSFVQGELHALGDVLRGLSERRPADAVIDDLAAKGPTSLGLGDAEQAHASGYRIMLSIARVVCHAARFERGRWR